MFLKKSKYSDGRTFLSVIQSYRDENGKPKHRTISKLGFLDDLLFQYDDPINHFNELIKSGHYLNDELLIKHLSTHKINQRQNRKMIGSFPLNRLYNSFNISSVFAKYESNYKFDYSLDSVMKLLVFSRILSPSSKLNAFNNKDNFIESFDFSLKDMYRALDHLPLMKDELLSTIWENTMDKYKRDASSTYYDCTNYYFEISYNDEDLIDEFGNILEKGYRKKGPSKEHRKSPIIQMGLLMDKTGIPMTYDLFSGNESEKQTLRPIIKNTKNKFNIDRTIIVADRGLNTSDNTCFIAGKNDHNTNLDGYVYGQSIRGANQEFKDWVLKQDDYVIDEIEENNETKHFKHKSRLFSKDITLVRDGKRKNKTNMYQKQMIYYSKKYALKQAKERAIAVEKSKDLINNPGKYTKATSYGSCKYINNVQFLKDTGEIADTSDLTINQQLINEEALYDGYYSIVTSETDLNDIEIRNIYKRLWKIEETFKITKSTLETRPVYVWTKKHIEAHFLTCFVSLVIIRLLEMQLQNKFSCQQIINSLKNYSCSNIKGEYYMFDYFDDCVSEISNIFGVELNSQFKTLSEIKKLYKS